MDARGLLRAARRIVRLCVRTRDRRLRPCAGVYGGAWAHADAHRRSRTPTDASGRNGRLTPPSVVHAGWQTSLHERVRKCTRAQGPGRARTEGCTRRQTSTNTYGNLCAVVDLYGRLHTLARMRA